MAKEVLKRESDTALAASAISSMMEEDAGQGISNRPEDNIVPQLKVLQPMSPEVLDGPDQVQGARPGDFLLGDKVVKGSDGMWFQPCFVDHKLFEFTPLDQGGGFVAEHPMEHDELGNPKFTKAGDPVLPPGFSKIDKFKYESREGNNLIHYRQLAGVAWASPDSGQPYVVSFKSTGHTTMRMWMTKAARANQFPDGRQRALFAHLYKLTTVARSNSKGRWYQLEVGDPVCLDPKVSPEVAKIVADPDRAYLMGRWLSKAFTSGERKTAAPDRVEGEQVQQLEEAQPF